MMDILTYGPVIALAVLGAVTTILKIVAPLTATSADDRALSVAERLVTYLSGWVTPKAKDGTAASDVPKRLPTPPADL